MPAEYGVYTISVIFVTLIQTMTYTGFFHYVVTAKGDEVTVLDTTFWLITGLSAIASAMLAICAPAISRIYDAPDLITVLWWLTLIQPLAAATAWQSAVLMRHERMRLNFLIMIAQNVIALIGGVALLVTWKSVFALVAFRYLRIISGTLLYSFGGAWPTFRFDWGIARHATHFSGGLYGTRLLGFLTMYGADLILGAMFSTAEAGLYRFGNRLATSAVDMVRQPMQTFALTQFGAASRADASFGPVLRRFSGTTMLLVGCVVGVTIVFGESLVRNVFQPSYLPALMVTYALAVRALFSNGYGFVEPVMAAKGRTGKVMMYSLVWMIAQVAAIFAFAQYGLGVIAWAQALVALASSIAGTRLMARVAGIDVRPAVLASLQAVLLTAIYGGASYLLFGLVQAELGTGMVALITGIALTGVLALATLAIGMWLRIFDLKAFSG